MRVNLERIRKKTVSIENYIVSIKEPFRKKFLTNKRDYRLDSVSAEKLRALADKFVVVVFSAEWCKDCAFYVSTLALLSEVADLEVRVFGGLKRDVLNPSVRWRVPPSPIEVRSFGVEKIPLIIVFDKEGKEVGRIVEKPVNTDCLEKELLFIVKKI
ncbi:MAG: thioredoxin family protein [Candidatus Bathyarchaeia archaeon]